MELSEMQERAAELEQQISNLPAGSITKKTVNGKDYFYHRWTENKKRREKYIPADELENFCAQIERRKALEQELKALKKQLPKAKSANLSAFTTNVRTGEALRSFAASVRGYRRRECFRQLHDFVCGEPQDKVFILYGRARERSGAAARAHEGRRAKMPCNRPRQTAHAEASARTSGARSGRR